MIGLAETGLQIAYIPLFTQNAFFRAAISFVRYKSDPVFCQGDCALIKMLGYHLNTALINARRYQELQTRQLITQQAWQEMGIGVLLTNMSGSILFINNTAEKILREERVHAFQDSILLTSMEENLQWLEEKNLKWKAIGERFNCICER